MTNRRLDYIDNIRILLSIVVILNHLAITYGAPGGWYYREFEITELGLIPMTVLVLFAAGNQAYSMGLFFLISGYFSAKSSATKKTQTFFFQRLIRLGLPVLLFVYLVSPILRLSFRRISDSIPINLENIFSVYEQINFGYELGPMWFILLLLIFSFFLPLSVRGISRISSKINIPGRYSLILAAIIIGLMTFIIRIRFPIGVVYQPLNLQVSNLMQYIFMFFAGVFAYLAGWLEKMPSISLKFWLPFTIGVIIFMPILFFLFGGASGDVSPALGGFTWQSLALSIWEQIFCISMAATLLSFFYNYLNNTTGISRELSAKASSL